MTEKAEIHQCLVIEVTSGVILIWVSNVDGEVEVNPVSSLVSREQILEPIRDQGFVDDVPLRTLATHQRLANDRPENTEWLTISVAVPHVVRWLSRVALVVLSGEVDIVTVELVIVDHLLSTLDALS